MFFNSMDKDAAEVANSLTTILRIGFLKSDYAIARGDTSIPSRLFDDLYVLGFIAGTTTTSMQTIFSKRRWAKDSEKKGLFILQVLKAVGLSQQQIDVLTEQMTDGSDSSPFSKGADAGELMLAASLNILKPSDSDPILIKARSLAVSADVGAPNVTPEALAHMIGKLTIISHIDGINDSGSAKDRRSLSEAEFESDASQETKKSEQFLTYKSLIERNLYLIFDIDLSSAVFEPYERQIEDYILQRFKKNRSSLPATVSLVVALYSDPHPILADWFNSDNHDPDEVMWVLKKCLAVIEHQCLDLSDIDYVESEHAELPSGAGLQEQITLDINLLRESLKVYGPDSDSELLTVNALSQYQLTIAQALHCITDHPRLSRPIDFVARFIRDASQLQATIDELESLKGPDFINALLKLLELEASLSNDQRASLKEEIDQSPHSAKANIPVVTSLILSPL